MRLPGIPDDDLRWNHWSYDGRRKGDYALTHIPSGLMVNRRCSEWPVNAVLEELIAELTEKLRLKGLVSDECSVDATAENKS